jgi:hypothetical protein
MRKLEYFFDESSTLLDLQPTTTVVKIVEGQELLVSDVNFPAHLP